MLCAYCSVCAPYVYLQYAIVALSVLHFSHDATNLVIDVPVIAAYGAALGSLLRYRQNRIAQWCIVGYLGLVHTPMHVNAHASLYPCACMTVMFAFMVNSDLYQACMRDIVERSAAAHDTMKNRAVLGIVGGHLITQVWLRKMTSPQNYGDAQVDAR